MGVSPSKGNQGTTRGKEKYFDLGGNRTHDLRIRSTVTRPTELRGRTEKVGDELGGRSNPEVVGSIPTEVKRFFLYLVHPRFPLLGLTPSGLFMARLAL